MKLILCDPKENCQTETEPIDVPLDAPPEVLIVGTRIWVQGPELFYYPATGYSVDKSTFFKNNGEIEKIQP